MSCQIFSAFSYRFYIFLYWAFFGVAWGALEMAANLNLTSEQLLDHNSDHDKKRQNLEIAAVILWCLLLTLDLSDIVRFVPFVPSCIAQSWTH